jgi:tRNA-2-methylthio-N6-dimethylallyladenosine synthase
MNPNNSLLKRYHLATYGCQMNEYDSAMIADMLEYNGLQESQSPQDSDIVLVNTCSIREKAEEHAYECMRQLEASKRKRPHMKIAVLGCMAKNHGAKILDRLPFVDFVIGPDNYNELEGLLFKTATQSNTGMDSSANAATPSPIIRTEFDDLENYFGRSAKVNPGHSHTAFITIQRGCNKKCAYCIVPFVRGKEKYRPAQDIVREASQAVQQGVREVSLLGQTVNSYRYESMEFPELLEHVANIPNIERVRFTSPHPRHFSQALIEIMIHNPKVSSHAHLPLQSGSDTILKKMRRQYSASQFLDIVQQLRQADPFFGITTDIIVGFVGESEQDFLDTLQVVKQAEFDNAFMFAYSPREGTESFAEKELLSESEKQARLSELIAVQHEITARRVKQMIGRSEKVMIDGPSTRNPQELIGKTDSFKKVVLPEGFWAAPGTIVPVQITEARGWTLAGIVK